MIVAPFDSTAWPDGVIQLLDEHHLVVLGGSTEARAQFAVAVRQRLAAMAETQVVFIDGAAVRDLPAFCRQLEAQLSISPVLRFNRRKGCSPAAGEFAPVGIQRVIHTLREGGDEVKRRYFMWSDADVMLQANEDDFGRVVNALLGVAAEQEHVSLAPLVLQRSVFLGGSALAAYAQQPRNSFSSWLVDDGDSPFWEVVSVLERPPVLTYELPT